MEAHLKEHVRDMIRKEEVKKDPEVFSLHLFNKLNAYIILTKVFYSFSGVFQNLNVMFAESGTI